MAVVSPGWNRNTLPLSMVLPEPLSCTRFTVTLLTIVTVLPPSSVVSRGGSVMENV
jgi:hypothetical protein